MENIELMDNRVVLVVSLFMITILLVNVFKILMNIFSSSETVELEEENPLRDEIREEVNTRVKPHLHALEAMHQKGESSESKFGTFVFGLFKETFSNYTEKDEKLVESEICKCCSDYEGSECKEEFCLDGSGITCNK